MTGVEITAGTESNVAVIQSSDDQLFHVDILFLSTYSDFFRCAFYGANKRYAERQRGRIRLQNIAHDQLTLTLRLLRELVIEQPSSSSNPVGSEDSTTVSTSIKRNDSLLANITLTNALEILDVASYLQIHVILSAISDVIFTHVTVRTLLPAYRKAEKRHVPLADRLWRVIVEDFAVLVRTGVFVELNAAQMLTLLRDPKLNLDPADEYPIVSRWLAANSMNIDDKHAKEMMELRAAASAYLARLTEPLQRVTPDPAITNNVVAPTLSSRSPSASPSGTTSTTSSLMVSLSEDVIGMEPPVIRPVPPSGMGFYNTPRIPKSVLLAVGGWASGGPTSQLEFFDAIRGKWMSIQQASHIAFTQRRAYHTVVAAADQSSVGGVRNCLYVVGGYDGFHHHKSVLKFNLDTLKWSEVGVMNEQRCYISGASLDDGHILMAGGFNETDRLRNAEIFDISRNQWSMCADMNTVRSDADCVNINGRVYVVGGFNGNTCHNTCEVYDAHQDRWTNVGRSMRYKRSGVKVTRIGAYVAFVAGGFTGTVRLKTPEMYDTREGRWHVLADMTNKRSNFGVNTLNNNVVVCGGYNNVSTTNLCETYDFRANRWSDMPEMSFSRSALALVRIDRHPIIADLMTEYDYGERPPIFH